MLWRTGQDISSKTVFKLLLLASVVMLLLPRRLTELGDRGLWLFLGPISQSGRHFMPRGNAESSAPAAVPADRHRQVLIENYNLQQQLRRARRLNAQLSRLSDQFGQAPVRWLRARVTGRETTTWRDILLLNHTGLKPGQIVLGQTAVAADNLDGESLTENIYRKMCVVGQIKADNSNTFRLQLLSDPGFSLPVFIEPHLGRQEYWEAEGLLKGKGMDQIEVQMVETQHPVQKDDPVFASSEPEKLPVEMLVGFVKSCRRAPENPLFWQIQIEPALDLKKLRDVIIVGTDWENKN